MAASGCGRGQGSRVARIGGHAFLDELADGVDEEFVGFLDAGGDTSRGDLQEESRRGEGSQRASGGASGEHHHRKTDVAGDLRGAAYVGGVS